MSRLPAALPHRAGCGPEPGVPARPRSVRGPLRAAFLVFVHLVIGLHLWHATAAERSISPLEPSEAGRIWTEGVLNAGTILLVLLVASTLVFGRFFCGWACHVVALQDASAWLLGKLGMRPRPLRSRLLAWVPVFAALEIFVLPAVLRLWQGQELPQARWELTTDAFWERFPGLWMSLATFFAVGFGAVWLLGAKGFCTYGCPYGALFGFADRFAKGRIRVNDACEGCGHCTAVCTSNVAVHREVRDHDMVVDPGCMKCTDCVSACPKDALSFSFGPLPDRAAVRASARSRYDYSWPEEVLLAALFVFGLYAFRGLYGAVPFLLAITLAVGLAVGTMALMRALRSRDLTLQHVVLRRAGRVPAGGILAMTFLLGFLGVAGHAGLLQWHVRNGTSSLERAAGAAGNEREGLVARADAHFERASGLAWFTLPGVAFRRGLTAYELGRPAESAAHFARAVAEAPGALPPRARLVRSLGSAGEYEAAATAAEQLLDLEHSLGRPLDASRVAELLPEVTEWIRAEPDAIAPTLLLVRMQLALGDDGTAVGNLERLAERAPADPRIEARLRQARSPDAAAQDSGSDD